MFDGSVLKGLLLCFERSVYEFQVVLNKEEKDGMA